MTEVDPKTTLDALSTSLTTLEEALGPLLAKPFEELTEDLEPLQKARLQVMSSYVVHDLVWIYLRTSGVDPSTHPVMLELQRLKGYFDKMSYAEKGSATRPARTQLDKGAAARFINAAIGSQRAKVDPNYTPSAGPSTARELGEEGTHTRFDEGDVDRLLAERNDEESDGEEGDDTKVESKIVASETPRASSKGNGKVKAQEKSTRPKMDPFAGYDDVSTPPKSKKKKSTKAPNSQPSGVPQPSSGEKRPLSALTEDDAPTPPPAGLSATPSLSTKKAKKLKKKESREAKKQKIA